MFLPNSLVLRIFLFWFNWRISWKVLWNCTAANWGTWATIVCWCKIWCVLGAQNEALKMKLVVVGIWAFKIFVSGKPSCYNNVWTYVFDGGTPVGSTKFIGSIYFLCFVCSIWGFVSVSLCHNAGKTITTWKEKQCSRVIISKDSTRIQCVVIRFVNRDN